MPTDRRTSDLARSIALGTTATAVVSVPTLGPLVLKARENAERYDTAITPPGYAFAVWAPIFAGLAATVNLSAGTQLLGADATSKPSVVASTLAAVGAAGALAAVIGRSRRGHVPLAAASAWGLLNTAADARRTAARSGTAIGAVAILATTTVRALRRSRRAWWRMGS